MQVNKQPQVKFEYDIEINIPKLIVAVEKRRPLYDTSLSAYRDRARKKKMWEEVCKETCTPDNWSLMSKKDKIDYGLEVQKKWNSLRNCFRREIMTQHRFSIGYIKKRKRKYFYYDSLKFLLPFTEKLPSLTLLKNNETAERDFETKEDPLDDESESFDSNSSPATSQHYDEDLMIEIENIKEEREGTYKSNVEQASSSTKIEEIHILSGKDNLQVDSSNISEEVNKNVFLKEEKVSDDGDEAFLQSLLPTIREFTSDQKLLLRIEIMKTIFNFKQSQYK